MNLKSITKSAAKLAIGAALTTGLAANADEAAGWTYDSNTLAENVEFGTPWVLNVSVANGALTVSSVAQVGDNPTLDLSEMAWPEGCPPLTTFAEMAFYSQKTIQELRLPETLTTIRKGVFSDCVGLKSVTPFLPANVSSIGPSAFCNCPVTNGLLLASRNLTELPENGVYGVFKWCPIPSVDMSKSGIIKIGKATFADGNTFVTFKMPKDIAMIGEYAFSTSPTGNDFHWQTISPNLSVGNGAFYEATDLVNRHFIPDGDPVWQKYLTTKCTFEPLSTQEKSTYREKYPGEKLPAGKFLFPGQKKIFWQCAIFRSNGMMLLVR